ncbi:cyclic nucleotide-binding domain-containing protein [Micromonospora echinospora]|uniref:cyclic nucleotide-binding domain-containing protein n=1 Tax=Micromonospora echinospora TaxID=1877 RepID=UPI00161C8101
MHDYGDSGLVAHLPQDEWCRVQDTGIPVRFEPRAVLLRQGDTTQHVHVVLAGCVKIVRSERDGSRAMLTLRSAGSTIIPTVRTSYSLSTSRESPKSLGALAIPGPW